jgi:molybdate transport system ATP-binding protein
VADGAVSAGSLHLAGTVAYDGFEVSVDLVAEPGATVAVVGPNGAGKTTLLRAVAGLRPLDAGRLQLGGRTLDDADAGTWVPPERRRAGVVFQDHLLFPHLDAVGNVAFGLRCSGVARREADRRAHGWLERVGLADRARSRPAELSGGEAQRVALARALAPEPEVLLLDEPLAALDATTRVEVRSELRRHLAEVPGVRLLVTHDPVDVAALADRVVVLEGGRVVQDGTPGEVAARPRTPWAASLAGLNLLSGRASGRAVVLDGGGQLVLADDAGTGPVLAALAPRTVSLHRTQPSGSARNAWPGRVAAVERVGERVRVRVDGPPSLVAEVTAASAAELALAEGTPIWFAAKATEVDVYPA